MDMTPPPAVELSPQGSLLPGLIVPVKLPPDQAAPLLFIEGQRKVLGEDNYVDLVDFAKRLRDAHYPFQSDAVMAETFRLTDLCPYDMTDKHFEKARKKVGVFTLAIQKVTPEKKGKAPSAKARAKNRIADLERSLAEADGRIRDLQAELDATYKALTELQDYEEGATTTLKAIEVLAQRGSMFTPVDGVPIAQLVLDGRAARAETGM